MTDDLFPPSLTELIVCAKRELGYRRRVYPRLTEVGRMTRSLADREIKLMAAIVDHLEQDKDRLR